MTARKKDLAESVRSPGFTPSVRDVTALSMELGSERAKNDLDYVRDLERALVRVGAAAVMPLIEAMASAAPPGRGRICRVIGRLEGAEALAFLLSALDDHDAKTRRNAILALGRRRDGDPAQRENVEAGLLRAWKVETRDDHRRSLAEALGKVGGAEALEVLGREVASASVAPGVLPAAASASISTVTDTIAQAVHRLERTESRGEPSAIDAAATASRAFELHFECRSGLEALLVSELERAPGIGNAQPVARTRGQVTTTLRAGAPLGTVHSARLWFQFGFPLPPVTVRGDEATAVAEALSAAEASAVFGAFTRGAIRYRLAWDDGGHRRALVWRVARAATERNPRLRNDPVESTWEARVAFRDGAAHVTLVPRALPDPRFTYRVGDVPAASHPTLAAALARVAGARADDVVWDPFAGSGGELVERAKLGPYAALHGSDHDAAALAVAEKNLAAAGVLNAQLALGDATSYAVQGVRLIITNPPMGRRVARGSAGGLLERFLAHASGLLGSGGRLVWLSPFPERSRRVLEGAGFILDFGTVVDLGGFSAELQCAIKQRR